MSAVAAAVQSSKLRWRQMDDHHCESNIGGYKVSRALLHGEMYWSAWKGRQQLDCAAGPSSAAMRAVCEADWIHHGEHHENGDGV